MVEDWKKYKLGDLIEVNANSLRNGEIDWINYIDIKSVGSGVYEVPRRLLLNEAPSRARRLLKEGDTVISSVRPNLKSFFYSQNLKENSVASTGFAVLTPKNIDSRFLYYLTTNDTYIDFLVKSCTGSAYPAFGPNVLINSEVTIPVSLQEQRTIGAILSPLDDRIEINLQMNKTLEEMAMTLYKHWFVDFGPFQEGEFVDSELGMIPKGWEVKRLDEILEIRRGGSPRPIQDFLSDEGLHWMKISDATASNSPFLYTTKEFIKVEGLRKTILIKPGSIILSNSATPGLPRLIEFETCIHDGWLHFPQINRFNRYILYLLFLDIKEHLIQQGNGSVFTNLKTDILKSQLIKLPSLGVEISFTNQITPWFEQIRNNTIETQTLTTLRDTLLPKLISGEVRVKEAVEMFEEVM